MQIQGVSNSKSNANAVCKQYLKKKAMQIQGASNSKSNANTECKQ